MLVKTWFSPAKVQEFKLRAKKTVEKITFQHFTRVDFSLCFKIIDTFFRYAFLRNE